MADSKNLTMYALSVAVGLIFGGGLSAAMGERRLQEHAAAEALEHTRLEQAVADVEADEEKTYDAVMELALAMARVEVAVDALAKR